MKHCVCNLCTALFMLAVGKIVVPMAGTDCVADTDRQISFPGETSRVGLHRERQAMTHSQARLRRELLH